MTFFLSKTVSIKPLGPKKPGQVTANKAGQELDKVMERTLGHALDRFGQLLSQGKTDWKSSSSAGVSAISDILNEFQRLAVINPIMNSLFGSDAKGNMLPTLGSGAAGGLLSGVFGSPGSIANGNIGTGLFGLLGLAEGGPVSAGQAVMVGESGREVFVPQSAGYIVPNSALGGGGGTTVVNVSIDAKGAMPGMEDKIRAVVRQELVPAVSGAVKAAVSVSNMQVSTRLRDTGRGQL